MAITASQVKELRERTGSGMMECKNALVDAGGDMDAAIEMLRKTGLAKADKKAGRVAAEGLLPSSRSIARPTLSPRRMSSRSLRVPSRDVSSRTTPRISTVFLQCP